MYAAEKETVEAEDASLEDSKQKVEHFDFVFIGAGMAAYMALKEIQSKSKDEGQTKLLMIGDEAELPYLRPPLSKQMWLASPEQAAENSFPASDGSALSIWGGGTRENTEAELANQRIVGQVRSIDSQKKILTLQDGRRYSYGKCLIATGARAVSLRHIDKGVRSKVHTLRTLEEWNALREETQKSGQSLTIVGGGYLGTELASSIASSPLTKVSVTQIIPQAYPMARVFPEFLGKKLSGLLEARGVKLCPQKHVVGVAEASDGACNIIFEDGSAQKSDIVVLALGDEVDFNLIARSGLEFDETHGGVVANCELQVVSDIWAAGDCVSYYDVNVGLRRRVAHVDHASMSGIVAARNMMGAKQSYDYLPVEFGSIAGLEWEGCGLLDSKYDTMSFFDQDLGEFEKGVVYYLEDGAVVGALTVNMPDKMDYCKKLVSFGIPIDSAEEGMKLIYLGK